MPTVDKRRWNIKFWHINKLFQNNKEDSSNGFHLDRNSPIEHSN